MRGDSWETGLHMPSGVLLEAYEYYDVNAKITRGTSDEIHKAIPGHPVWRLYKTDRGIDWTQDAVIPEDVLLQYRFRGDATVHVGYAPEVNFYRERSSLEWKLTGIAREQLGV